MSELHPPLTFAIALSAGVVAQAVARQLRVPGLVLLLAVGVLLGPDGLAWIDPRSLGNGLFSIVHLAVAVILFEGGLNLEIARLRRSGIEIRRLVVLGSLVTIIGASVAATLILQWPLAVSLLFGSLVVVTGPTVVGPLLRELRLRPRVATVLEAEGVLIDPVGAILAVMMLDLALARDMGSMGSGATTLLLRIGFGGVMGVLGGYLLGVILRMKRFPPEGFGNIFTLAFVLLLSEGCREIVSESGVLAVTLAGVMVGNMKTRVDRDLREFKDQLTVMLIGMLFILLAADVRLDDLRRIGWGGVGVVSALVWIVRPMNVFLSTKGTKLTVRERLLVAWLAPRGIVAAAVASITAQALEQHGLPGGPELRAMVFLTIAGTVTLAGLTASPIAQILGVRLPGRDRVAILGAQGLGMALGQALKHYDVPVIFIDSNPQNCRDAQEAGFSVVYGNGLEERTMQRARFESVGTVIGLTANQELNELFAAKAREAFRVPTGFVALGSLETGVTADMVRTRGARVLFEGPHDVGRWDVRARRDAIIIQRRVFAGSDVPPPLDQAGERHLFLTIARGGNVSPMYVQYSPRKGDEATIAIHTPDREAAEQFLTKAGWIEATGDAPDLPAERPAAGSAE